MSEKKNQHYVPRYYFRYFSGDGKRVSLLSVRNGKTIKNAPIKSQCSKDYFYGEKEIEETLEGLENEHREALNKLKSSLNFTELSEDEYCLILQAVLFQRARTLAGREKRKRPQDKLARLYMEVEINNDTSLSEEEKTQQRESLGSLEANPKHYQGLEMIHSIQGVEYIIDMIPLLLINRTNHPFVFSDAPVVAFNNHQMNVKLRGVLGYQTPGLQLFYPLCDKVVLLLLDPAVYEVHGEISLKVEIRNNKDIDQINKLQIHNAFQSVYFSDHKYAEYVKRLWNEERISLIKMEDRFIEAPGYDQDGKPIGDIIHVYEPLLPFRLNLSFLKFDVVGDEGYKFARRHELIGSNV